MPGTKEGVSLPEIRHLIGCPAERMEAYTLDAPRKEGEPYRVVSIVRCGDCGNQEVHHDQGKLVHDYRRSLSNGIQN